METLLEMKPYSMYNQVLNMMHIMKAFRNHMHMYACIHTESIQNFVSVEFNQTTKSVLCNFHNQRGDSIKSCSTVYGPGEDCTNLSQSSSGNSTRANSIAVDLMLQHVYGDSEIYCFHVTATSGTFTAVVQRIFNISHPSASTYTSTTYSPRCNPADLTDGTTLTLSETVTCGVAFSSLRIKDGIVCYSGSDVGSIAAYFCLDCGFKSVVGSDYGSFIRMCTEEGKWNGTVPQCDCSK